MEPLQISLPAYNNDKLTKVLEVFDESVQNGQEITLAYSGGKDSTLLTVLFYEWLKLHPDLGIKIRLLHNDTMSEIDPMEGWARSFMLAYKLKVEEITNSRVELEIRTPIAQDTFYWRAIIRGYPPPSFNFRWCVHLLKEKPAKLDDIQGKIFTGLRESESKARKQSMTKKYGNSCGATPGGCMAYYYSSAGKGNEGRGNKVAPFRDWSDADVWEFLWKYRSKGDFDIEPLFKLYPNPQMRYGCWHCTLASVQMGLHALNSGLEYFEAVRILYRKFSDLHYLRVKKTTGYSTLGPLNATGRSILLELIALAEELAGVRLYGLDYNKVGNRSLREVFFELPSEISEACVKEADPKLPKYRHVSISRIRSIGTNKNLVKKAIKDVRPRLTDEKSYKMLISSGRDPFATLLKLLEDKII